MGDKDPGSAEESDSIRHTSTRGDNWGRGAHTAKRMNGRKFDVTPLYTASDAKTSRSSANQRCRPSPVTPPRNVVWPCPRVHGISGVMINEYSHAYLRKVLHRTRTVAAVGVSLNEIRPSFFVGRYLAMNGFKVIPVNPVYAGKTAFGNKVYKALSTIPKKHDPIDMVDIFRRSEDAGRVVDEALDVLLDRGLKTIWMQIGVIDEAAAKRAEAKGVEVLMNICPKMEYQRLWGELSRGGINSGVITSKLGYVSLQLPDAADKT